MAKPVAKLREAIRRINLAVDQHAPVFIGCTEVALLTAMVFDQLGFEAVIQVGRAQTPQGEWVAHVWVELPEMAYSVETNPSQLRHLPAAALIFPTSTFEDYEVIGSWPADEDRLPMNPVTDPTFARLRQSPAAERFYTKLAKLIADSAPAR